LHDETAETFQNQGALRAQQVQRALRVTFCKGSATALQHNCQGFEQSLPCFILHRFCTRFAMLSPCFCKALASATTRSAREQQIERPSGVTFCKVSAKAQQHICQGFKRSFREVPQYVRNGFAVFTPGFCRALATGYSTWFIFS